MYCPDDGLKLNRLERNGIEIYECTECGGLWTPVRAIDYKNTLIDHKGSSDLLCLSCQEPMNEKIYRSYQIIVCEDCQYAWIGGTIIKSLFVKTDKAEIRANDNCLTDALGAFKEGLPQWVMEIFVNLPDKETLNALAEIAGEAGETVVEFFAFLFSDISN